MNVVLDTNVFISGIFWKGDCNRILNHWKDGKFTLISSLDILSEFTKVLKDFKIKLSDDLIKEWIELIVTNSIMIQSLEKLDIVKDDPKDNMFVETALTGKADYIITNDKHLLKLKEFRNIKIITPEEFLKII
ncbi:MAG: putative toxin-antitoxin system toxin component, PIN family [archaeon]